MLMVFKNMFDHKMFLSYGMLKAEYDLEITDKGGFLIGSKLINTDQLTVEFLTQRLKWDGESSDAILHSNLKIFQ